MTRKNLWGDFKSIDVGSTPAALLREQAALLGEMTQELLTAEVSSSSERGSLYHNLSIVAPPLDGYRVSILRACHGVEVYPVMLDNVIEGRWNFAKCQNESEFLEAVSRILGSERVRRVVASLLAQVRDPAVA